MLKVYRAEITQSDYPVYVVAPNMQNAVERITRTKFLQDYMEITSIRLISEESAHVIETEGR